MEFRYSGHCLHHHHPSPSTTKRRLNPAAALVASLSSGAVGALVLFAAGGKQARDASPYDPSRQRFMKSRRCELVTFCATACLRQVRRASFTQTAT